MHVRLQALVAVVQLPGTLFSLFQLLCHCLQIAIAGRHKQFGA
jgi:hypothetical protein